MLRIHHLVLNIDKKYQKDKIEIQSIRNAGLPYEPKTGKEQKDLRHLIFGLEMNTLK